MRCHQRLTGSANGGGHAFHAGHVGNKAFIVYASGLNVVLLDGNLNRVQIISVSLRPLVKEKEEVFEALTCLEVSPDHAGVLAVAGADATVRLFTPVNRASSHIEANSFGYWWVETACLTLSSPLTSLTFLGSNQSLITATDELRLWRHRHVPGDDEKGTGVVFNIGQDEDNDHDDQDEDQVSRVWECVWRRRLPTPISILAATVDGRFFATAAHNDRLVRVWFKDGGHNEDHVDDSHEDQEDVNFAFIYLAHPASVTSFSWRKTSVYMCPSSRSMSVPSVLVTSCVDSICRLWSETQLPPDDTVHNMDNNEDPDKKKLEESNKIKKKRMWQRMRHMRQSFDARREALRSSDILGAPHSSSETLSPHEMHLGQVAKLPVVNVHFHLAATVNAATDIPLVPAMKNNGNNDAGNQANFVLHWMNNKEVQFTAEAENLIRNVFAEVVADDDDEDDENNSGHSDEKADSNEKNGDLVKEGRDKKRTKKPPPRPPPIRGFHTRPPPVLLSTAVPKRDAHGHGESSSTKSKEVSKKEHRWCSMVERRYEQLMQDWHQRSDLLFAVHPVDGSFLVWVADFIDPYQPGAFRQTQVSFSSRIPSALPLGDAMTLNSRVELFNANRGIDFLQLMEELRPKPEEALTIHAEHVTVTASKHEDDLKEEEEEEEEDEEIAEVSDEVTLSKKDKKPLSVDKDKPKKTIPAVVGGDLKKYSSPPELCLITKHTNGTLNLWTLLFEENTSYCTLLNISHAARASGHRFEIRAITPHPVLPLVITTSHNKNDDDDFSIGSELILWRIEPVGPLPMASGGVTELARINHRNADAFNDVAWLPTLLPCMTSSGVDGHHRGSPSAVFVADDGDNGLRVYQAVIDARHLLAGAHHPSVDEGRTKAAALNAHNMDTIRENSDWKNKSKSKYNVVSSQSNARPGAILQLDYVCKSTKKWGHILMLHVFQEQLIGRSDKLSRSSHEDEDDSDFGLIPTQMEAMVNLEEREGAHGHFAETFFVVMAEKMDSNEEVVMHVWKTSIKGTDDDEDNDEEEDEVDEDDLDSSVSSSSPTRRRRPTAELVSKVRVMSEKVATQSLSSLVEEKLLSLTPAVGHLSSSSMYPACLAPYLMVSASSNRRVRFWRLQNLQFEEWQMADSMTSSHIDLEGDIVDVKAAYSGRIAIAHRHSNDNIIAVSIFECESTGGSEWILEDTVHLRAAVQRPLIITEDDEDLRLNLLRKQQRLAHLIKDNKDNGVSKSSMMAKATEMERVPSFSALEALRRDNLARRQQQLMTRSTGNATTALNDHNIMLDWVSKEDGSHLLTVCVNNKLVVLTAVSTDISEQQARAHEARYSLIQNDYNDDNDEEDKSVVSGQMAKQKRLRKSSSMAIKPITEEIRWMKIRKVVLHSADGLTTPSPSAMAWVRDGVLMCALKAEMEVFSQWRSDDNSVLPKRNNNDKEKYEDRKEGWKSSQYRSLKEEDIYQLAQESQMRGMRSHGSFSNLAMAATMKHATHQTPKNSHDVDVDAFGFFDLGLFEAAHIASPVLPQYHPKQLMELIHSGKIRWVKAILAHLVRCVHSHSNSQSRENQRWTRSRTLSVSAANASLTSATLDQLSPSAENQRSSISGGNDDLGNLDYNEIHSIPPLPLWTLLAADSEIITTARSTKTTRTTKQSFEERHSEPYDVLFNADIGLEEDDEDVFGLDTDLDDPTTPRRNRTISSSSTGDKARGLSYFGPREAGFLSGLLTHAHLPGLTSLDQMHLLALADTVSSVALDPTDRLALAKTTNATTSAMGTTGSVDSLDACGLRFLFALQHFSYLKRCLPLSQRASLQRSGLMPSHLIWAFHSDNTNDLLNSIPSVKRGQPLWSELREVGVAWWLRHYSDLKALIEKVAKAAFQRSQDPLDAALFYLALGKQSLLCALYRSIKDERMRDFFSNNFNEERWRKAALKNAFALLGKQRFHHAAAFFVLASRLEDALQICLDKLDDLQLAMVVARLQDGERESQPVSLKRLVYQHVLGRDAKNLECSTMDLEKAHPDPFLRSMALWMNGEYTSSLSTLVELNVGHLHAVWVNSSASVRRSSQVKDPSIFNFYIYLRNHPLILKQQQLSQGSNEANRGVKTSVNLSPLERRLYFSTAHFHLQSGCPALAVEVLSKLPDNDVDDDVDKLDEDNSLKTSKSHEALIRTGTIDEMDWGQPVMQVEDDELKLDWGSDDDDEDDEDDEKLDKSTKETSDTEKSAEKENKKVTKLRRRSSSMIDVMAQQLKFIACLRIMMEELATLATGFEVDGGMLRCQLYLWLEREVEALRHLCNYGAAHGYTKNNGEDEEQKEEMLKLSSKTPTLHEVMRAEKEDFEAKLQRAAKRKHWLRANQTLLRTLLSYCSLHGGHGSGLASVRMELVLLLQELQQERSHNKQLLSPLPLPTMLPLLSACIAQQKTVVVDPIRHLQALSHDMIMAMSDEELPMKPTNQSGLLRDLSVALSSCIYQSLCDSENSNVNVNKSSRTSTGNKRGNMGPGSAMLQALSLLSSSYQRSSFLSNSGRRAAASVNSTNKESPSTTVITEPSKWPGVTSLRAWLDREKDDDLLPNLTLFLCETFAAVFLGLMHFALASSDAQILYRLASLHDRINDRFWAEIFGGGSRRVLQVETNRRPSGERQHTSLEEGSEVSGSSPSSGGQLLTRMSSSITKQRVKLNIKVLGMQIGSGSETASNQSTANERATYQEHFVPPETSMISKLIAKPQLDVKDRKIDYDSGEESDDGDEEDEDHYDDDDNDDDLDPFKTPDKIVDSENDNSEFAWALIRTACIKLAQITLESFVSVAGVDLPELPVNSPLLFSALRITESWLESSQSTLSSLSSSSSSSSSLRAVFTKVDVDMGQPAIEKYSSLFDSKNAPFPSKGRGLRGVRRLWHFLVRQTPVQRLFVQHIFGQPGPNKFESGKNKEEDSDNEDTDEDFRKMLMPVKVIHKDNEAVTAFCINRKRNDKHDVSSGLMTVATSKELLELNISQLLNPSTWHDGLHDETHFDVLNLNEDPETNPQSNLLVVQSPNDHTLLPELRVSQASIERARASSVVSDSTSNSKLTTPTGAPAPFGPSQATPTATKGASLVKGVHFAGCQKQQFVRLVLHRSRHLLRPVKRHRMEGVRKLAAHTHLPLYVTGCDDGCIRMWEWSHSQPVQTVRQPGVFARVNKIAFSQQGNKFGAADQDGHIALWQAANAAKPFYSHACHRHTHDFVFSGECSSLVCVAGESGDNLSNVAVLDTLMPQRRSLVVALAFHDGGASSLLFVPDKGPTLISAGRRDSQVAIWDLRQTKQQVHVFKAHQENGVSIRSLALDPCRSSFFVTGSSSGDIRLWDSNNYRCLANLSDEHTRQHGLFKNVSQGVSQLHVDQELRLFSCGADGAMKLRQLPSIQRLITHSNE